MRASSNLFSSLNVNNLSSKRCYVHESESLKPAACWIHLILVQVGQHLAWDIEATIPQVLDVGSYRSIQLVSKPTDCKPPATYITSYNNTHRRQKKLLADGKRRHMYGVPQVVLSVVHVNVCLSNTTWKFSPPNHTYFISDTAQTWGRTSMFASSCRQQQTLNDNVIDFTCLVSISFF